MQLKPVAQKNNARKANNTTCNINMKLKTIPKLCAQLGKAVYNKWCGPAQIYKKIKAQKCMMDNLYEKTGLFAALGKK